MLDDKTCQCCGKGGRGKADFAPKMWMGCRCPIFGECVTCSKCFEHCECIPLEQRIDLLAKEEASRQPLVDEAINLAVRLGIESVESGFTEEELGDLENSVRRQYLAVKRLKRRWNKWAELYSMKHNLETELVKDAQDLESDRIN